MMRTWIALFAIFLLVDAVAGADNPIENVCKQVEGQPMPGGWKMLSKSEIAKTPVKSSFLAWTSFGTLKNSTWYIADSKGCPEKKRMEPELSLF